MSGNNTEVNRPERGQMDQKCSRSPVIVKVSTCEIPHYLVFCSLDRASNAKVWRYELYCTSTQQIQTRPKFVLFSFFNFFFYTEH